jgi:hypothetical protein
MTKDARTIAEAKAWIEKTAGQEMSQMGRYHVLQLIEALESYGKEQYEKGVRDVIQIIDNEPDLRMDELVSLKREALALLPKEEEKA